jgi:hypothetical protein
MRDLVRRQIEFGERLDLAARLLNRFQALAEASPEAIAGTPSNSESMRGSNLAPAPIL